MMDYLCKIWCSINISTIVELIAGALLAILTTIIIEKIRRPKLMISIAEDGILYNSPGKRKHLILQVMNSKLWFLPRYPAINCTGTVTFHHIDNDSLLIEKTISIRWASLPEPRYYEQYGESILMHTTNSFFDNRPKIDIYAGEPEPQKFTFTIKFNDDSEFYGFNNESYLFKDIKNEKGEFVQKAFKNPDWAINVNECLVKIELYSTGKTFKKKYKIINGNGIDGFRIEEFKK